MLDLSVSGISLFARYGDVLARRPIARDPLSGVVDGANKTFFSNYFPLLTSGSVSVRVGGVAVTGGSADYDTGEFTLANPPSAQPEASYTFTPFRAAQVLQFLTAGFDEMEMRWFRGFKLVDGSGNPADESSAQILVADSNGVDPPTGSTVFSLSRVQIAFLMLCTEYRYYLSASGDAAISDFMFRETLRGMTVDKSKRPDNLQGHLAILEKRLQQALVAATDEYFPDGSHYGAAIDNPVTRDYAANFEWQTASINEDIVGTLGYQYSLRPF